MTEDNLLPRAFQVEGFTEDLDLTVPPSTGQEYLQHVMYEASRCPQVVVADIDRSKLKNNVNVTFQVENDCPCISELAPSIEWQQIQVATFSVVRQKVARYKKYEHFKPVSLPKPSKEDKWYNIFFGEGDSKVQPLLKVVLSMNESLLGQVLEYHVEWLEDGLKPEQGRWIYAILACLDLPLTPIICSLLRDLARQCAKLRNLKTSCDDDVAVLNLIICLVSKYFGQADLAD